MKNQTKFSSFRLAFSISFYFLMASTGLFAQKIESTPFSGAGRIVMYTYLKGVIGNKEIRGNVRSAGIKYNYNLLVYENGKRVLKKDMEISFNGAKYVPVDYFIKEDKIVGYFIAGSKNSNEVKLCLQEFNTDLEQIGDAIEIAELPKAIDPAKLLDNKSGGMFSDKEIQEQDLLAKYDKVTGNILFCFSLQLTKEHNLSYSKIILLDGNYSILNAYEYKATSGENYIKASPQAIFENGDALVAISDGIKVSEKNSLRVVFNILKQVQIFIPSDGSDSKELELMPDQSEIVNIKTAEKLTKEENILYCILSRVYDQNMKSAIVYFNLYKYKVISRKLERESYKFPINDIFPNYGSSYYQIKKIYDLADGSVLIWLSMNGVPGQDYGNAFIKIDKNNQLEWIKDFRKQSTSPSALTHVAGAIDYFDVNGNLNLVFNFHPKKMEYNTLKTGFGKIDLGSIPIIATVDLSNGEIKMRKMAIENTILGGMMISESEKLDDEGKYRLHMMINKKLQFVDIDFNAN